VAVIIHVCELCFYVDYTPMAWTMLLYGCFNGLDYVVLLWSEICAYVVRSYIVALLS
jgi:hypothetical protein